MAASTPTDIRDEGLVVEHPLGAWRCADPAVEPLEGRVASLPAQPRRVVAGAIFAVVLYCLIIPIISPYDPNEIDFAIANETPSLAHLLRNRQVRPRPLRPYCDRR